MKKQDIVCISMTTWEGDFMKTIVHMMSQLAKNHRVMFVDYPFTWKDFAQGITGKEPKPWKRMIGIESRLRTLESKGNEVYHLTLPPVVPTNWINDPDIFQKIIRSQAAVVGNAICKAMKKLNFESPIVINAFNPIIGVPLIGKLNESKLVYYCYDDIGAANWCGKHGGTMEDRYIKKVDEVIVTSEALLRQKSKQNTNTTLVKNGVDFELFNRAFHQDKKERPVIGYVGSLDFRLDYDLIENLVKERPEYDFHFIGRVTQSGAQSEQLKKHPNVRFFGAQQPNDIPKFMKKFDLGIIPFAMNDFTKSIYPLKINEYLAAGIPVVSTDFAPLDDFFGNVVIAKNAEQFINGVDDEFKSDTYDKKLGRTAVAKQNDWSKRAAQVEEILNQPVHA